MANVYRKTKTTTTTTESRYTCNLMPACQRFTNVSPYWQ